MPIPKGAKTSLGIKNGGVRLFWAKRQLPEPNGESKIGFRNGGRSE